MLLALFLQGSSTAACESLVPMRRKAVLHAVVHWLPLVPVIPVVSLHAVALRAHLLNALLQLSAVRRARAAGNARGSHHLSYYFRLTARSASWYRSAIWNNQYTHACKSLYTIARSYCYIEPTSRAHCSVGAQCTRSGGSSPSRLSPRGAGVFTSMRNVSMEPCVLIRCVQAHRLLHWHSNVSQQDLQQGPCKALSTPQLPPGTSRQTDSVTIRTAHAGAAWRAPLPAAPAHTFAAAADAVPRCTPHGLLAHTLRCARAAACVPQPCAT